MSVARDVVLVARHELGEAVRSRLLIVIVVLFVGVGSVAAWGYSAVLEQVEMRAASAMSAPQTRRRGGLLRRMRTSRSYKEMMRVATGSDEKAEYYATIQPMVLFFGWMSFNVLPWLVLFTTAESVAGAVASRGIRYGALRTGRLELAAGKMAAQTLIIAGVSALAAVAFYAVACVRLDGIEHGATILGLLSYWPRVFVYLLPFLGWSMFASMITASANLARILALAGGVALAILSGVSGWKIQQGSPLTPLWELLRYLTPFAHRDGLSYPPGGALLSDIVVCLALTTIFFVAGFARLRGRDL